MVLKLKLLSETPTLLESGSHNNKKLLCFYNLLASVIRTGAPNSSSFLPKSFVTKLKTLP
jgi:hypothetical protein